MQLNLLESGGSKQNKVEHSRMLITVVNMSRYTNESLLDTSIEKYFVFRTTKNKPISFSSPIETYFIHVGKLIAIYAFDQNNFLVGKFHRKYEVYFDE